MASKRRRIDDYFDTESLSSSISSPTKKRKIEPSFTSPTNNSNNSNNKTVQKRKNKDGMDGHLKNQKMAL